MKFSLTSEQLALQEATRDFFQKNATSDSIRQSFLSDERFDVELFNTLRDELGLVALVADEKFGGLGASDIELAVVLEQIGYFLVPTPLRSIATTILMLQECVEGQNLEENIDAIINLNKVVGTVFDAEDFTLVFGESDSLENVHGRFARIPFGASIEYLYFVNEFQGQIALYRLDCSQEGVKRYQIPSIDQTQPLGAIELDGVTLEILATDCEAGFERARSKAIIALCNEVVGSTQAVLDMSVAYAKDRVQFGRPIGSFQAIKHKCADMLLETESSRSIALFGAWLASQESDFISDEVADDLSQVAAMAKYYCCKALSHAAGENIQIHGGIGFTMEHDAQLYFKRAAFMNAYLGLPSEHAHGIANSLSSKSNQ